MTAFTMGAVTYDPKVVTIWDGFRSWLTAAGLPFDYVLYSHYERQVEDLIAGRIDAAWNSPLAWIRARRLAKAQGLPIRALVMRDTDRDLTTAVVVRTDSDIASVDDLRERTVATGAVDSPQATLLPLEHLRSQGLQPGTDFTVHRFDVGVGLHGDHVGGERDAARALIAGEVDAACVLDGNHLLFTKEGVLPPGSTRLLTTTGLYDHCNMTVTGAADPSLVARFEELLRSMSYADPTVRPLLDLEGLTSWKGGRIDGYDLLESAVTASGFYDGTGTVTAAEYRP
ncbi:MULTISPECIES: phosphate/phosphite/phosphonate ABC transporter substrate-binding protein [unclassified Micromonospora]|uniref:phosphate/phosphite/phosphonate ABC transporter substrate-binding protein n=1 Tax=unclassified Micromonospora TaxID=2617518 RepID=UPI003A838AEB